jgi:hypothetical protein
VLRDNSDNWLCVLTLLTDTDRPCRFRISPPPPFCIRFESGSVVGLEYCRVTDADRDRERDNAPSLTSLNLRLMEVLSLSLLGGFVGKGERASIYCLTVGCILPLLVRILPALRSIRLGAVPDDVGASGGSDMAQDAGRGWEVGGGCYAILF